MMIVQAELSLYPLGEADLLPAIDTFVRVLARPGLTLDPGPMSTLVCGESALVFDALRQAYETVSAGGRRILVIKMLNHPGAAA